MVLQLKLIGHCFTTEIHQFDFYINFKQIKQYLLNGMKIMKVTYSLQNEYYFSKKVILK
jgi:hypothetical protein